MRTSTSRSPRHFGRQIASTRRRGFTLIEILVVVTIILILVSLLFPLVAKVRRKARYNAAWMEVRQLESAWKSYIQDYVRPPTNTTASVGVPFILMERRPIRIEEDIAKTLAGENPRGDNPRMKRYMVFQSLNEVGNPVNPWYADSRFSNTPQFLRYYVKFDVEFDGHVRAGAGEPNDPPNQPVPASVIVWTHNPDVPMNHPERIIGSWKK